MQTYPITLSTLIAALTIQADGALFAYESAAISPRTNLLPYSEQMELWTKTRTTVTANAIAAPDSNATAEKLVEDTTVTSNHLAYELATIAPATVYTWSVYAKAAERTWLGMSAYDGTSHITYFNLAAGTVGTNAAGNTPTITPVGGGWYRCTLTRTTAATTTGALELFMATGDAVTSYTGDGASGLYLWGAQLEKSSFATPYIKNATAAPITDTSTADTRIIVRPDNGAEIVLKPGQNFRMPATAGSWYVRSYDGVSNFTATLIIGAGIFNDNSTIQSKIVNDSTSRVPVTLDLSQVPTVAVQNAGRYGASWVDTQLAIAGDVTATVFSAAANVNGAWVEAAQITFSPQVQGDGNKTSLLAKSSAPASVTDGALILHNWFWCQNTAGGVPVTVQLPQRIFIPAGVGLYLRQSFLGGTGNAVSVKSVLYTLL